MCTPNAPRLATLVALSSVLLAPLAAHAGIQVGPSGRTYASDAPACALHPVAGWSPWVAAGLLAPKKNTVGVVGVNRQTVAVVSASTPEATVWLPNGVDTVTVSLSAGRVDRYIFDVSLAWPGQPNACVPDTRGNVLAGDVEYGASAKSYATIAPACALNPATGRPQWFVNLFDNGTFLLNVTVDGVPLTQLNGTTRDHVPVFLSAGLNVITAANGALSTDAFVREGGTGTCTLP